MEKIINMTENCLHQKLEKIMSKWRKILCISGYMIEW